MVHTVQYVYHECTYAPYMYNYIEYVHVHV